MDTSKVDGLQWWPCCSPNDDTRLLHPNLLLRLCLGTAASSMVHHVQHVNVNECDIILSERSWYVLSLVAIFVCSAFCPRHKCSCNGLMVLCCLAVVCNKFLESLVRHAGCACSLCDGCSKLHHSIDFVLIKVVAQAISSLRIQSCLCNTCITSAILQDCISSSRLGLTMHQRRSIDCH